MSDFEKPPKERKKSLVKSKNCIQITDENFEFTHSTTRDEAQVNGTVLGSLEETAFTFPRESKYITTYAQKGDDLLEDMGRLS